MAKLFSSLLNNRVIKHYENLFADQQFGFRANHRTMDSIFILKSLISKYLKKNKEKIYACFVDLRKAFDSLWHNGLIYKLMLSGIGQKLLNIINDMYSLSKSAVKIQNKISNYFHLQRGVKQGDSLSPTLFNCFINDMHSIFDTSSNPLILEESKIASLSFADDLVILSSTPGGLQNSLDKLEKYCFDWQLTVNIKKTKIMTFQNVYTPPPKFFYKQVALEETKEYNFLGNIIDFKGNMKRAIQELSKKGLKVLFSLKNRFLNFQSIPVDLSCKLFDILVRPILLYNCEIWFMDDYSSVYRSLHRAEQNDTSCDILSLEDKFCYEKIHNRFCKSVLGLKKSACNIAGKSELGRIPLSAHIKAQVLLYYSRMTSDANINPLLKEAFSVNKSIHEDGIYTWYSSVLSIFKELNIDITEFKTNSKPFLLKKHLVKDKLKKLITEYYHKKTTEKIESFNESSKLFLYSKLKSDIKLENYLLKIPSFKLRQLFTKFRVSDHSLEVEIGRYKNIPREARTCKNCNSNDIDDEHHFFLNCTHNLPLRTKLFNDIAKINPEFLSNQPIQKLKFILNFDHELLSAVGDFIKHSLDLRK